MSGHRRLAAGLAVLLVLLTGCAGRDSGGGRTLTVLAAASLTEAFRDIGAKFSAEHPGVRVRFNFQGSTLLAEQIRQGRSADVYASADTRTMAKVVRAQAAAGQPRTFATNRLTIAVPAGNPAGIASLADLARPGPAVVVCAPQVPCGAATQDVERITGVRLSPVSEESNVKAVLNKVIAGEADAGLVYVTDARAAGEQVRAIDFPASKRAVHSYPAVVLKGADHPELAAEFARFLQGTQAREILGKYGFGTP
ncbi:molybdate transport system substrate-binding protein [Halopolyspora algeriensis]|uniref:Molybdate transport system substrate-binding protein n=1 Tax=Halopolyspora algeriensis TaxID=1500506 RepID=A0A368VPE7_9ACTN|nr:molybdate ABC transporter substrate-binding protein [Halopolyspora algeriensis]RCW43601.1 molybdate transport system substrate-binding protein [Halopolyspora algeriensis]TQM47614.1 molybdate transport system substrate-binding protein [Halopolyspora algeriensis]